MILLRYSYGGQVPENQVSYLEAHSTLTGADPECPCKICNS